ncbi:MAG TPA: hypothetical protein PKY82_10830 [Pyrinomonadaceae bacterium]|nr:hypothetical protein [Pyrinomonadaceae bacterium]
MDTLKANVTVLRNNTKTYCDYFIWMERMAPPFNVNSFLGPWEEIKTATPVRSGFTRMNPLKSVGVAYLEFQGIGCQIWLSQNAWMLGSKSLADVNIHLEVWQHGFPSVGENMAKKTEFGPVSEIGIALFWKGVIA